MRLSSSKNKVPPSVSSGVFALTTTVDIEAPRDKVWKVLMDWDNYSKWNPFVRNQKITDRKKKPRAGPPAEGDYLLIGPVHTPPTFDKPGLFGAQSAFETITVLDHENYRCAWENVEFPKWIMRAERWQMLTEVEMVNPETMEKRKVTRYDTIEVFGGVLAYIIKWIFGKDLGRGFKVMGEGLKARSESL